MFIYQVIRDMLEVYDPEDLANFEPWLELTALYTQMKKMLPDVYLREATEDDDAPVESNPPE